MNILITIGEVVFAALVICGVIVFVDAIKNAPEYNDEQVNGDREQYYSYILLT